MRTGHVLGAILLMFAAAVQAEPPKAVASPATAPATPSTTAPRPPLKLRVGDVRHYMLPHEYREAIEAPDLETTTVVVQGQKLLPMKSLEPVQPGLLAPIWALMNPSQGWRIFLPDPNSPAIGPPDVVPKPIVRLGP